MRRWLVPIAVTFSLCFTTIVFVAWVFDAYVTWPRPDSWRWVVREFTIGFDFHDRFLGRVPYSVWMLLTLILPIIALGRREWRAWRALRASRGAYLCPGCGYDLRASVDRCPECGMDFPRCEKVQHAVIPSVAWQKNRAATLWRRTHSH